MNLFQSVGLMINRNNYEYVKKEIEKSNDSRYITYLVDNMNPTLIDLELMKSAIEKGYYFNHLTPKEILNNKDIILYALENKGDIDYIINHASSNVITIDIVKKYFDEGKYYVNSNTPQKILANEEFVKYVLCSNTMNLYKNEILKKMNQEIMNDELFFKMVEKGYYIDNYTPSYITSNPKYMAYVFVNSQSKYRRINYDYVIDGFKTYLESLFDGDKSKVDNVYKSIKLDELLNNIDEFVYQKIDNNWNDISENLYRNNRNYVEYIINYLKNHNPENNYYYSNIDRLFSAISPSIIDIKLIKSAIDAGLDYHSLPDNFKDNDEVISEYLSKGKFYDFYRLYYKSKEEKDRIFFLAIDKGMTFNFEYSNSEIKKYIKNNNEVCIYAASKGNFRAIDYLFEKNDEINKKIDEIVYNYIDNGKLNLFNKNSINTSYTIATNEKYFEYFLDRTNDSNLIQTIVDSTYDYVNFNIKTLKKIIDKGYNYNYNTPIYLKDLDLMLYAAAKGDIYAIEFAQNNISDDDIKHMNLPKELVDEDFFKYIVNKGYYINDNTPNFIKNNYNLIKIYLENSKVNLVYWIAENVDKELLSLNNFQLFKLCLDKGYRMSHYTKATFIKSLEVVKYAANKGDKFAIDNYLIDFIKNKQVSEDELYSIILSALNNDYYIHRAPDCINNIIRNNDKLLQIVIDKQNFYDVFCLIKNNDFNKFLFTKEQLICIEYMSKYKLLARNLFKVNARISDIVNLDIDNNENSTNDNIIPNTLNDIWNRYFKQENLCLILFKQKEWDVIIDIINTDKDEIMLKKLSSKHFMALKKYNEINDKLVQKEFMNYIISNIDNIDNNNINMFGDLLFKLATTNSMALYSMRLNVAEQLLNSDNPEKSFEEIENIFIKNNIPLFAKMYMCMKILYPEFRHKENKFNFSEDSRMAPELKDNSLADFPFLKFMNNPSNNDIRFLIIYNDLLRNAIKSNSIELRQYLDNIELGNYLYLQLMDISVNHNTKFDKIPNEIKEEALRTFVNHLEAIYRYSKEGKLDKTKLDNMNYIEKLKYLKDKIKPTSRYDLPDRIIRMYCYSAGYKSFKQLKDDMNNAIIEANNRNIKFGEYLETHEFEFEDGDFVRCIGDVEAFSGSMDIGNYSKEYLTTIRRESYSDTTPLDIDFTRVINNHTIYHSIQGTPTGFGFGNIYLIMKKDNPNINITRLENDILTDNEYDPKKLEMFATGYKTHWGVRTGFSLTDVDVILYKKTDSINDNCPYDEKGNVNYVNDTQSFDDLSRIKFEIARHGYYIPVLDFSGKLIFTVDEYYKLREKMNGLSYYEVDEYKTSDNLDFDGIEQIVPLLNDNKTNTITKRNKVYDILKNILSNNNLSLKTEIDGDLTPGSVEVIDTGSTGRETNDIGSGDFDFLLRVDQIICRDSNKYSEFKNDILKYFEDNFEVDKITITGNGDYRLKGVHIDNTTVVDIDLSFMVKTDKITYATVECLKNRLNTIKEQDNDKYQKILANIIIAKKFMKKFECYKPYRSDNTQGGMGGAGIENWILQNGGSFIDAVNDFYSIAKDKDFDELKKEYFVWDFGQNHFAERKWLYPYDNFIDNMSIQGYNKMKEACRELILNPNIIQDLINNAEEYVQIK